MPRVSEECYEQSTGVFDALTGSSRLAVRYLITDQQLH